MLPVKGSEGVEMEEHEAGSAMVVRIHHHIS